MQTPSVPRFRIPPPSLWRVYRRVWCKSVWNSPGVTWTGICTRAAGLPGERRRCFLPLRAPVWDVFLQEPRVDLKTSGANMTLKHTSPHKPGHFTVVSVTRTLGWKLTVLMKREEPGEQTDDMFRFSFSCVGWTWVYFRILTFFCCVWILRVVVISRTLQEVDVTEMKYLHSLMPRLHEDRPLKMDLQAVLKKSHANCQHF